LKGWEEGCGPSQIPFSCSVRFRQPSPFQPAPLLENHTWEQLAPSSSEQALGQEKVLAQMGWNHLHRPCSHREGLQKLEGEGDEDEVTRTVRVKSTTEEKKSNVERKSNIKIVLHDHKQQVRW
jgi:hypothetical protein